MLSDFSDGRGEKEEEEEEEKVEEEGHVTPLFYEYSRRAVPVSDWSDPDPDRGSADVDLWT